MMKENIYEYHPNGMLKYKLKFYDNGNKWYEQYYDEDDHNDYVPDYQKWYENGFLHVKTFFLHDNRHNNNSPAVIWLHPNGKIEWKSYYINNSGFNKLDWQNNIKNI